MSEKEENDNDLILPPIKNTIEQKTIESKEQINNKEDNNNDNNNGNILDSSITNENKEKIDKSKEKEKYIEEIESLKKELEEKNRILIELKNEDNPEYIIPNILGQIEAQRLLEISNENKIKQQQTKIESIKKMVKNLDEQFKYQLKMKEQKINRKLEPFFKKNNDLLQEINSCKEQMKQLNERFEKSNNNLMNIQKEKSEMEELIIKREEKLNIFFEKLNMFEELIKKKNKNA